MIRILTAEDSAGIKLTIDGSLVGEYAQEAEISIRQAINRHRHVSLFLRDVSNIDDIGRSLLSRLAGEGVELSASGIYCSYVVASIGK